MVPRVDAHPEFSRAVETAPLRSDSFAQDRMPQITAVQDARQRSESTGLPLYQPKDAVDFSKAPGIYKPDVVAQAPSDGERTERTAPPERKDGRYISETVDRELQKKLDAVGVSKETAEKVLGEINQYGADPQSILKSLMEKNRVVAMGETHQSPNPQRDVTTAAMPALKAAGATHLAIEAGTEIQSALDEFNKTGKLDRSVLPILLRDNDFMNMLNAARENGIKVVAVDASQPENPNASNRDHGPYVNRDEIMANNIGKILDGEQVNPGQPNKVIFFVGSAHLNSYDNHTYRAAGPLLKEKYSTATVRPIYEESRGNRTYPLSEITSGLRSPVGVSNREARTLGNLPTSIRQQSTLEEYNRNWDYTFIYPDTRRK